MMGFIEMSVEFGEKGFLVFREGSVKEMVEQEDGTKRGIPFSPRI